MMIYVLKLLCDYTFWCMGAFACIVILYISSLGNDNSFLKKKRKAIYIVLTVLIVGACITGIESTVGYQGIFTAEENSSERIRISDYPDDYSSETEAIIFPKGELSTKEANAMILADTVDLEKDEDTGEIKCTLYPPFSKGVSIGNVDVKIVKNIEDTIQ